MLDAKHAQVRYCKCSALSIEHLSIKNSYINNTVFIHAFLICPIPRKSIMHKFALKTSEHSHAYAYTMLPRRAMQIYLNDRCDKQQAQAYSLLFIIELAILICFTIDGLYTESQFYVIFQTMACLTSQRVCMFRS